MHQRLPSCLMSGTSKPWRHVQTYMYMTPCYQGQVKRIAGCNCRFQAILSIQEGVSVFRVVETNDFNQLPHITLAFRPGNDAAVKSFLASRLLEVRTSHTSLERDLSRAQVRCHASCSLPSPYNLKKGLAPQQPAGSLLMQGAIKGYPKPAWVCKPRICVMCAGRSLLKG